MTKERCQADHTSGHPCFDSKSHCTTGRIHLPVAPRCNIQCNYCTRKHDCANENRPGVTTKVISPEEAVDRVGQALALEPRIHVVGVAGPGDPLANEATFTALSLVRERFPGLALCLSTNGLLLPEKIDRLADLGLDSLTVTVNTLDENTGAGIYAWVRDGNRLLRGPEAAAVLRDNQLEGIRRAVARGLMIKVNSVIIPGCNDTEMATMARTFKEMGVDVMNIMPLIPQAGFAHLSPVPEELHRAIRRECAAYLPQIAHCRQCRADAAGLLGQDLDLAGCRG